jgi:hypothetical protein
MVVGQKINGNSVSICNVHQKSASKFDSLLLLQAMVSCRLHYNDIIGWLDRHDFKNSHVTSCMLNLRTRCFCHCNTKGVVDEHEAITSKDCLFVAE